MCTIYLQSAVLSATFEWFTLYHLFGLVKKLMSHTYPSLVCKSDIIIQNSSGGKLDKHLNSV